MEERQVIVRRPGWRPVRSYLILFGVLGAAAAAGAGETGWLIVPAVLLPGLAAFMALATVRGRTEITADGVRNRLLFRLALIPWSDIRDAPDRGAPLFPGTQVLLGRTDAEPDGVRNRLISRAIAVPWKDVDGIAVIPTLFGRIVEVRTKGGRRVRLAAPREGLLDRAGNLDDHVATVRALAGGPPLTVTSVRAARTTYVVLIAAVIVLAAVSGKF